MNMSMMAAATAMIRETLAPDQEVVGAVVGGQGVVHAVQLLFFVVVYLFGAGGGGHGFASVKDSVLFQEFDPGSQVFLAQLLPGVGVGVHARADDGHNGDKDDEDQSDHRAQVAEVADAYVLPEALGGKVGIQSDLFRVIF